MPNGAAAPAEEILEQRELSFRIQINRAHYTVHQEQMTGEQLSSCCSSWCICCRR